MPGRACSTASGQFIVKITLNTSIPENQRPQIETLVKSFTKNPEILWLPSRFPRYVMFIEPGKNDSAEPSNGSIFESPKEETESLSSLTACLEEQIKASLKKA